MCFSLTFKFRLFRTFYIPFSKQLRNSICLLKEEAFWQCYRLVIENYSIFVRNIVFHRVLDILKDIAVEITFIEKAGKYLMRL